MALVLAVLILFQNFAALNVRASSHLVDSGTVIGIDLGTTYSCVAVWRDGREEVIPNEQGHRTTPSWVAFTGDERLIGEAAKNAYYSNPSNTVFDVKRFIGRRFIEPEVSNDVQYLPYKVEDLDGNPVIRVEYRHENRTFSPQEISAMLLGKMKETAETYLQEKITRAVITVPAYFNDAQRQATKDAGRIAGFSMVRLLNEPTAAAIAYGVTNKARMAGRSESTVLVYDLGGGTLDVSLLSLKGEAILSTSGDTHLGGEDFDNRVMDWAINRHQEATGRDARTDIRSLSKLKRGVENAKQALSSQISARIDIEAFYEGKDLSLVLTRANFEALNHDLFLKTLSSVDNVLRDAKLDKEAIDEVVLVGGSTRIPKLQAIISDYFLRAALSKSINPDEAIALGAAIEATNLSGTSTIGSIQLVDICPLSLGVETSGGIFTRMINRNMPVPAKRKRVFSTVADNQSVVTIRVYEGERAKSDNNLLLGQFDLRGIGRAPAGIPQIEVSFDINSDGILEVSAVDMETRRAHSIRISESGRLSNHEVDRMIREAELIAVADENSHRSMDALNRLQAYIWRKRQHVTSSAGSNSHFLELLENAERWIGANSVVQDAEEYEERLAELQAAIESQPKLLNQGSTGDYRLAREL
ncbi:ATPase with role in protein import into the ER [Tulasnella sp. 403]|nr:ATPase with role in protein import into the ER [Tulasnella sp. 403]